MSFLEGREGERNGLILWREIKEQGYSGSERTVYRYLETLKQAEVKAPANLHRLQHFCATTAIWLFVRDPNSLDEIEQDAEQVFRNTARTGGNTQPVEEKLSGFV